MNRGSLIEEGIGGFLKGNKRNAWIAFGPVRIYLRMTYRPIGPNFRMVYCLDIATVEIDAGERGQGWLTAILDYAEARHSVFVECIQLTRLMQYLERRGYKKFREENAYKIKT